MAKKFNLEVLLTQVPGSIPGSDRLSGMRVLLVEDSEDNQLLISILLKRLGAKIEVAGDGKSGMEAALAGQYDVILMDVQMPVMDGVTAVRNLRQAGYTGPILALTAHAMKEERNRCLEAGFTDFLSKPIHLEKLILALSQFQPLS